MNFLKKIKNSIYGPAFYTDLKEQKLSFSLRYFLSLAACLSLIIAFFLGVKFSPFFATENLRSFVGFYPQELSIEVKGGTVSTNVSEPYIIKSPTSTYNKNLVVIDTKNDFSLQSFKDQNTEVLIGKHFVVLSKGRGQFEFNDITGMPDFSLSKDRLLHWVDIVGSHHRAISFALFIFLFVTFFGMFSLKLVTLFLVALLIMLLLKLKKIALSYKQSYQIALHAVTVPIIFDAICIIAGIRPLSLLVFILSTLIIASINTKSALTRLQ